MEELLNPVLKNQKEKKEQLLRKREVARSLYRNPDAAPLLEDLLDFLEAQIQGCKDGAATTDNATIEKRYLHMLLMGDIIKTYIQNQRAS